jgi:L-ascorbate peroxidase
VRLYPEIDHATNAKLEAAVSLLQPLHGERKGWVSWSDLIQMAGAVAVEVGGGERVPMRYGRLQVNERRHCAGEGATGRDMVIGCRFGRGDGGVEGLVAGDGDATVPGPHAGHLRKVFSRMGLGDGAAVALLGNPSIRRSFAEKESSDSLAGTRWRGDASPFDNVFFEHVFGTLAEQRPRRGEVEALLEDAGLRSVAEGFAGDRGLFYKEYARAHAAMAECGACFEPREGILLDDGSEGRGRGVQDGGGVEAMQVD